MVGPGFTGHQHFSLSTAGQRLNWCEMWTGSALHTTHHAAWESVFKPELLSEDHIIIRENNLWLVVLPVTQPSALFSFGEAPHSENTSSTHMLTHWNQDLYSLSFLRNPLNSLRC